MVDIQETDHIIIIYYYYYLQHFVNMAPKRSMAWEYFEVIGDNLGMCKMCLTNISYKSGVSNLTKHLQRRHPSINLGEELRLEQHLQDSSDDEMKPKLPRPRIAYATTNDRTPRRSVAWDYFVDKGDYIGVCNICDADISFKSGVSNLTKHIQRKHLTTNIVTEETEPQQQECQQDLSEEEKGQQSPPLSPQTEYQISIKDTSKENAVWEYFEDIGDYIGKCNICETNISFLSGVSQLTEHIQRKHLNLVLEEETESQHEEYLQDLSDDELKSQQSQQSSTPQTVLTFTNEKSRKRSVAWEYFVDKGDYTGDCNLCNTNISYRSGVSNLTKHVKRKHPSINIGARETEEQDSSDEETSEFRYDSKSRKDNKPAKRSMVWNYFVDKGDSIARCNVCKINISFKSGVSNLSKHIQRKHPECLLGREKESQQLVHGSFDEQMAPLMTSPEFLRRDCSKIKNVIEDHIMNLFLWDLQPFTIVEDKGFRAMINFAFPNYVIPPRKYFASTLLSRQYKTVKASTKAAVNDNAETVCLTTDVWASRNEDSYLAVMGHYIDKNFVLQSLLLECKVLERKEMEQSLAEELQNIVQDWNISDKVLLAVSDSDADIKNAFTILQWKHFVCFAHTLNIAVQKALENPAILGILNKVKAIISDTHLTNSNLVWSKLKKYQELANTDLKRPIQDEATKWNLTLYMLQGFVEHKEEITSALRDLDDDENAMTLTSYEWGICESLILVLQPCEEVSKEISCQKYLSGSTVLPITITLTNALEDVVDPLFPDEVETCREDLLSEITTRFSNVESSKTFTTSTFLDPRFKLYFGNPVIAEKTKRHVIELVTDLIDEEHNEPETKSQSLLWEHFNKTMQNIRPAGSANSNATVEVEQYLDDKVLSPDMNPLDWWRSNQARYPYLAKLARSKLNLMAISVPCKHLFSAAWNITDREYRTESNKVQQLLFLQQNKK